MGCEDANSPLPALACTITMALIKKDLSTINMFSPKALTLILGCTGFAAGLNAYPVTDTDQENCYGSNGQVVSCGGTGQDASYTTLEPSYADNGDETITDLNTDLMWTQAVYGDGLTFDEVLDEASTFSLAGYEDWRVPTIKELYPLSQFNGRTGTSIAENIPFIDESIFEVRYGTVRFFDGQLWSSNQYSGSVFGNPNQECNFGYNSIDGRIKCYPITSTTLYARYVRGNENVGTNVFFASSVDSDIIVDAATGLEWMRADNSVGLEWDMALEYCNDLTLGSYDDWRLPDAHELQSIVDYSRSPDTTNSAAIDPIFESTQITNEAGDVDFGWYWTSTTHLDGIPSGSYAVYITFGRAMGYFTAPNGDVVGSVDVHGAGAQRSDPKTGPVPDPNYFGPQGDYIRVFNYVRCVRGSSSPSTDASTSSVSHVLFSLFAMTLLSLLSIILS